MDTEPGEWKAPETGDETAVVSPERWQQDVAEIRKGLMWYLLAGIGVVVAVVGLAIWLLVAYQDKSSDHARIAHLEQITENFSDDQGRLADAVDKLREQIRRAGMTPTEPPSEDLIEQQGATDPNDPDPNDPERQDPEIQDPENQDPERQDPENQDAEVNDPDPFDDPDSPNDPDPDDPEIQDAEIQDPEIDDPDPGGGGINVTGIDVIHVDTNDCIIRLTLSDGSTIDSPRFGCPNQAR